MAANLNVVVIEDNDDLRESIVELLNASGHKVRGLWCAEALSDEGAQPLIDLLILDLNLPGEDGLSLARRLRLTQPRLHIVMMTARNAVRDKVDGYEAGADIYLTKPVSIEELGATVRAIERRVRLDQTALNDEAELSIDIASLKATGPTGPVELSSVEIELLAALARAPRRRLAYWQLLEILNSGVAGSSQANLAVRMTRLRKKLGSTGVTGNILQAIRPDGCYQLCCPARLL